MDPFNLSFFATELRRKVDCEQLSKRELRTTLLCETLTLIIGFKVCPIFTLLTLAELEQAVAVLPFVLFQFSLDTH